MVLGFETHGTEQVSWWIRDDFRIVFMTSYIEPRGLEACDVVSTTPRPRQKIPSSKGTLPVAH